MGSSETYSDRELHIRARQKLLDGELPKTDPVTAEAHRGAGEPCALCERPLPEDNLEFDLYFDRQWTGESLKMHISCCRAWEQERHRLRDVRLERLPPRSNGSWENLPD